MLLIDRDGFRLSTGKRLVKAEEVSSILAAQDVLAAAEAEAARIREDAKAAFETERRRGYEKGLSDGKKEIFQKKLAMVTKSVEFMQSVEQKMVTLVMTALRKIVGEMSDEEKVIEVVRQLMNAVVRAQQEITVSVSPLMADTVRARVESLKTDYPQLKYIQVEEDKRLAGTACKVETAAGGAEASVETQLAALEASLNRSFAKEG